MRGLLPSSRGDLYNNAKTKRRSFFKNIVKRRMRKGVQQACCIGLILVPLFTLILLLVSDSAREEAKNNVVLHAPVEQSLVQHKKSIEAQAAANNTSGSSGSGGARASSSHDDDDEGHGHHEVVVGVVPSSPPPPPQIAAAVSPPRNNLLTKLKRQAALVGNRTLAARERLVRYGGGLEALLGRRSTTTTTTTAGGKNKRPQAGGVESPRERRQRMLARLRAGMATGGGEEEKGSRGTWSVHKEDSTSHSEGRKVKPPDLFRIGDSEMDKSGGGGEAKVKAPKRIEDVNAPDPLLLLLHGEGKVTTEHEDDDGQWAERQGRVVAAFRHAWSGYARYAMGYDELQPLSRRGENSLGGLGATVVDALDTAMIMDLGDVVEEAGKWVEQNLGKRLSEKGQVNLFETTIRVLGGLLSAYHLSRETINWGAKGQGHLAGPRADVYLSLAEDLAERLMAAFESSPTAVPYSDVHLGQRLSTPSRFDSGASSTAEVTTLHLEFWALSKETSQDKFGAASLRVIDHVRKLPKTHGLVPIFISPHSGQFQGNNIRLGSRGDSYYEYLLKTWVQQGGARARWRRRSSSSTAAVRNEDDGDDHELAWVRSMYDEAMAGVKKHLIGYSKPNNLTFVGELPMGFQESISPKMDHLVCFLAGSLALGATGGLTESAARVAGQLSARDEEDLRLAKELARTCYEMYAVTATGLAPEIAYFNTAAAAATTTTTDDDDDHQRKSTQSDATSGGKAEARMARDIIIQPLDRHCLLRPETVEALFYLFRITQDNKYRNWGWQIFEAFEKHARVETGGYSSLEDVTRVPPPRRDKMESFFLGETLKYFYLLFGSPNVVPLTSYVFNTEAHPLPIFGEDIDLSDIVRKKFVPGIEIRSDKDKDGLQEVDDLALLRHSIG